MGELCGSNEQRNSSFDIHFMLYNLYKELKRRGIVMVIVIILFSQAVDYNLLLETCLVISLVSMKHKILPFSHANGKNWVKNLKNKWSSIPFT